jgi:hypothetical protein
MPCVARTLLVARRPTNWQNILRMDSIFFFNLFPLLLLYVLVFTVL